MIGRSAAIAHSSRRNFPQQRHDILGVSHTGSRPGPVPSPKRERGENPAAEALKSRFSGAWSYSIPFYPPAASKAHAAARAPSWSYSIPFGLFDPGPNGLHRTRIRAASAPTARRRPFGGPLTEKAPVSIIWRATTHKKTVRTSGRRKGPPKNGLEFAVFGASGRR
jgi:hypothetical protein